MKQRTKLSPTVLSLLDIRSLFFQEKWPYPRATNQGARCSWTVIPISPSQHGWPVVRANSGIGHRKEQCADSATKANWDLMA